jgi:hypothetical protein
MRKPSGEDLDEDPGGEPPRGRAGTAPANSQVMRRERRRGKTSQKTRHNTTGEIKKNRTRWKTRNKTRKQTMRNKCS